MYSITLASQGISSLFVGPSFWKSFFKLLTRSLFSLLSAYHSQTNGQTERMNQEIWKYLRSYCHDNQQSWNSFLPWAEYSQNFLRQPTTSLTPFQCILSFQPPLFPWMDEPSEVPAVDHWYHESESVGLSSCPSTTGSLEK